MPNVGPSSYNHFARLPGPWLKVYTGCNSVQPDLMVSMHELMLGFWVNSVTVMETATSGTMTVGSRCGRSIEVTIRHDEPS